MLGCLIQLLCGVLWQIGSMQWCFSGVTVLLLHWRLFKEKVEGRVVVVSFLLQAIFIFFFLQSDSILPSYLPTHALFLLLSVHLYRKYLEEKLELRDNFCFSSDLPKEWFEDEIGGEGSPLISINPQDNLLRTSLKCLAVVKKHQTLIGK